MHTPSLPHLRYPLRQASKPTRVVGLWLLAILGLCTAPTAVLRAQATTEWQVNTPSLLRPKGLDFTWTGSGWTHVANAGAIPQTAAESSNDWWYDLAELKIAGDAQGYVTVGYSGAQNWGNDDGCFNRYVSGASPKHGTLETVEHRRTGTRGAIARYNLDGSLSGNGWYKSFYAGLFLGVIQDPDGNIVATGHLFNTDLAYFDDVDNPKPFWVNPVNGGTLVPLTCNAATNGPQRQMFVMKLSPNGEVLWNHVFNPVTDPAQAINMRTEGWALVQTRGVGGEFGYRIVGAAVNAHNHRRPYVVQLDADGNKLWDRVYDGMSIGGTSFFTPEEQMDAYATAIDRVFDDATNTEHYVMTGLKAYNAAEAWAVYTEEPSPPVVYVAPSALKWASDLGIAGQSTSTSVKFVRDNGGLKVIWPVIGDIQGSIWAGEIHYAKHAHIKKLSIPALTMEHSADLGELHAFDLQLGVANTSDGNIVAVCTKWPQGYGVQSGQLYDYQALTTAQQAGLLARDPSFNWDQTYPAPYEWATFYGYWGTQSYMAKLDGADLGLLWEYQWHHDYTATDDTFEGNLRRRQCNFNVIEAQDGAFVVCGNTGHNFDDAYLAKVKFHCDFQFQPTITHVCEEGTNMGTIELLVYGGSGNFTYQWSNGATTPTISGLAPGVYTVVVTDQEGDQCAETEMFTVAGPMTAGQVVYSSACVTGGYPSYTASVEGGIGPFTYFWYAVTSNDNHPPEVVWYHPVYSMSPGHWPPSYVEVHDVGTGCQVYLNPYEPTAPVVTPTVAPANCISGTLGSITLELNPAYAPYTFAWSNGATTQNITDLEVGSYTVIINYGVSCSETHHYTVADAEPCCTAAIIIPHGAHSSDYAPLDNTYFNNTSLKVLGTFHIDNNCFIINCTVYMEAGAEIVQESGANLVIRNSQMEDCNGVMWRGITVNNGAYLELQNNVVKDAENTVTALNGSTLLLFANQFIDNRVVLYVPPVNGVPYNSVSTSVIGNYFGSTGTLAQPYPGQATTLGSRGYAAVEAYKTSLDLTGYTGWTNTVEDLSNGVLAYNSDLSVERFTMTGIQSDPAYADAENHNGSGIFAKGVAGNHFLTQRGHGKYATPSFVNCMWGVNTRYMNTDSRDNNMQGVGTGYRVDKARNETYIMDNQVVAKLNGMDLRLNAGTTHFWVQDNDIAFGTLTELIPAPLCSGILVSDGNDGGSDSRIEGNTIQMMDYQLATSGITLYPARNWLVAANTITMANNSFNRYGIAQYGSSKLEVSCNQVQGALGAYGPGQAAIYSNMGDNLLYSCNDVDRTANGMLFNGVATGMVDVQGNKIRRHKFGLRLSANALIGGQDLAGNLWYNQPATGGLGAWYEMTGPLDPNPAQNPFTYNPASIEGGNTEPPSWEPDEWFQPVPGANYECSPVSGDSYCGQFQVAKVDGGLTGLDELVARDSLQNDPYTAETRWMLKEGLYRKLNDDPDLLAGRPDMAAFYADMQGTATAAFKLIDDGRPALFAMDSTVSAQLQANADQIAALMDSVKVRMDQLQDSTLTPAQTAALLAGLGGFRQSMQTLSAWNSTTMQVARDSKVLTAEGLKTANSNIAAIELIETNRKMVEEIYLSTVGKEIDTFTVAQADELFAIANQCPMVGGNAVYTARSLYRLIDDSQKYDDQLLCLPHGIIVKRLAATEAGGVHVQPNPARDQATLVLDQPFDGQGVFVLVNMVGQEVFRKAIPMELARMEFSTASMAPGLYHYQVRGPSGKVGEGKLAITR